MDVTYTNTIGHVFHFHVFHVLRTRFGLMVLLPLALPLGYMTWVGLRRGLAEGDSLLVTVLTVMATNLTIGVVIAPVALVLLLLGAWISAKGKGILTEHTMSISPGKVLEVTPVNRSEFLWAGVEQIRQSRNFIYLYVSGNAAHIIPKTAFDSPAEAEKFLAFAQECRMKAAVSMAKGNPTCLRN